MSEKVPSDTEGPQAWNAPALGGTHKDLVACFLRFLFLEKEQMSPLCSHQAQKQDGPQEGLFRCSFFQAVEGNRWHASLMLIDLLPV